MLYLKINLWNFEKNSYIEIRFLWNSKQGLYRAASFIVSVTSSFLRKDIRQFTSFEHPSVLLFCLLQLFCQWTTYVSLSDYMIKTLIFYTFPMRIHVVINVVNQNALSGKHVSIIFLPRIYDVISQLRHSYIKDPLCVTRLKYYISKVYFATSEKGRMCSARLEASWGLMAEGLTIRGDKDHDHFASEVI